MAPRVKTGCGSLRGSESDGVLMFRGIPFAEPPIGELRWRPPERIKAWSGERDATAFGPSSLQRPSPGGDLIGIPSERTSEDCLYLNVWTPGLKGCRPVMVWIHGGANVVGSGSQPRINGEHLARRGDVVVVTLNYRLGALGFLLLSCSRRSSDSKGRRNRNPKRRVYSGHAASHRKHPG